MFTEENSQLYKIYIHNYVHTNNTFDNFLDIGIIEISKQTEKSFSQRLLRIGYAHTLPDARCTAGSLAFGGRSGVPGARLHCQTHSSHS